MDTLSLRDFEDIRIPVPWGYVVGRWYGNRKVRPILALHGWLDNLGTWDTLVPLMPAHIGVLCIDFPGHGQSSKYPKGMTYQLEDYVHTIVRVMKEYNWQKVSLMGHSMGGVACFMYATMYPRTVDLLISIDIIKPPYRTHEYLMDFFGRSVEKSLVEDERLDNLALQEPPSYTYKELERLLYEGSRHSVDLENCKYILNRSIAKSTKYPDKYFFMRDGKVKYYREFNPSPALAAEMARCIHNVPYFLVKATRSKYITQESAGPIIEILRRQNPHFEMHEIEGTHHVHLNNAKAVAAVLNPYISRHRPMVLESWSVDEESADTRQQTKKSRNSKFQKIIASARQGIRSKL